MSVDQLLTSPALLMVWMIALSGGLGTGDLEIVLRALEHKGGIIYASPGFITPVSR